LTEPSSPTERLQTMDERYGVQTPNQRRLKLLAVAAIALALLAWVGWAAWSHGRPDVKAQLNSYDVLSPHEVVVVVDVHRRSGDAVTCTLQAQADDHVIVGEKDVTIPAGDAGDVQAKAIVRTDRKATTATVLQCALVP
jgi:hypothetical protein